MVKFQFKGKSTKRIQIAILETSTTPLERQVHSLALRRVKGVVQSKFYGRSRFSCQNLMMRGGTVAVKAGVVYMYVENWKLIEIARILEEVKF